MKKEKENRLKNSSFLPTVFFMIIGGMCGFFGVRMIDSRLKIMGKGVESGFLPFILIIILMYLAIFLQIIVHEGGPLYSGSSAGISLYPFV